MPLGGAIVGGIGALGSAIFGGGAAADKAKQAAAAKQEALQQWLNVNVPDPAQQKVEMQKYAVTGQLSPKMEQAFQQDQSGLKGMQIDQTSRNAEVSALSKMQDLANNGGMDDQAKEQEAQAMAAANANERGQRGAILNNAAARGVGGSGATLAAQLEASQGDANQAAAVGQASASSARERALQALGSSAGMASNLNAQDYGQAARAAEAQDAINRFNVQNKQGVEHSNVGNTNSAEAANLANAQRVADANVGVGNSQEAYNKGLSQQNFNNQQAVASGRANALGGVANTAQQAATDTSNMWGKIGGAISGGVGAYSQNKQDQQRLDQQQQKLDQEK